LNKVCNVYGGDDVFNDVIPLTLCRARDIPVSALTLILLLGCSTATGEPSGPAPAACRERPYWPTERWQRAPDDRPGLASARMAALERFVADSMPNLRSLMVVRGGYVVAERYWGGADSATPFDIRSSTKSFTSAIVGEAIAQGYIRGLDQRVYDFFPEYYRDLDPASWKWRIQVKHLLTMTAGLEWNEQVGLTPRPESHESTWLTSPSVARPGNRYIYSSGNTHMLSIAITRSTKQSLRDYGNATIFRRIGMEVDQARWPTDAKGYNWGGTGLELTARQMAKFGYLYLNDGCWNGEQVVARDWVEQSTLPRVSSREGKLNYGYLWWTTDFGPHHIYLADGHGGQMIMVVPDLDLVVVTTAVPDPPRPYLDPMVAVRRFVLPAATEAGN
jgi:CubicO group peptidase (beta-lactamase class C family)